MHAYVYAPHSTKHIAFPISLVIKTTATAISGAFTVVKSKHAFTRHSPRFIYDLLLPFKQIRRQKVRMNNPRYTYLCPSLN